MSLSPVNVASPWAVSSTRSVAKPFVKSANEVRFGMEMPKGISFRKFFFGGLLACVGLIEGAAIIKPEARIAYAALAPAAAVGVYDAVQKKHSLRRNFPLLARLRWIAEGIRPEIQQYFIESDTNGKPFTRLQRSNVYQRAKNELNTLPFGTQKDLSAVGTEWISHSIAPVQAATHDPRIMIGGPECRQPYASSLLNISAMSYGALSKNAVLALNLGAKKGGFAHNTGEGGISPYHLEHGGDLIWQIGTGYFGCRNDDGTFNAEKFAENAKHPNVKMIELKLSQGAKPGHGGILPAKKLTPEIAAIRGVPLGKDVLSPPAHSAFDNPIEMLKFVKQLRELSGGKPVGIKLCIGHHHEFLALCKAMVETGIVPDYIAVDGAEGGTGAAPREFSDYVGMPLNDALVFAHNALVGVGVRDKTKLIVAGKIIDAYDMISKLAMGADACYSARGMMFALGCIQALKCHNNTCPTGVATQDEALSNGLNVEDKGLRTYNYQHNTIKHVVELCAAAGLGSPNKLKPYHIQRRTSPTEIRNLEQIYHYVEPGDFLKGKIPAEYENAWKVAEASSFRANVANVKGSKTSAVAPTRIELPVIQ